VPLTNPRRLSIPPQIRSVLYLLFIIVGGIIALGAINSSRAIGQRTIELSSQDAGSGRSDSPGPVVASSPPQCPGCLKPSELIENLDDVTPPTLPFGWAATNVQGPPPLWVTSNSGVPSPAADTLPNAAFVDDPGVISDKLLDFGMITIFEACCPVLTFRHNFNLEASEQDPNLGFDGGVLEISVDQGQTYQDILDAGGTFIMGGYNRIVSTDRGSPIAGRLCWSGNSNGFITTVVGLPGIIPGGLLRWRMASDNSGSGEGWRVDTVDVTWCQGGPSCTPTPPPSATPTLTPTPTPPRAPCPQYAITEGAGSIVPGTTDTGNHCVWCDTMIFLPFPFVLYDQTFNTVNVSSNGRLDFVCNNEPVGYTETCPPAIPNNCPYDFTIFALWHEWYTGNGTGCSTWASGCGVFTSISGTAPNRIFNIEWRVVRRLDDSQTGNFEVRLYENDPNKRFDVIYGVSEGVDNYYGAGVQGPVEFFTPDFCNGPVPQNRVHSYQLEPCGTPSVTPTLTPTPSATVTPTVTPTPTATPRATPRPRPAPHVRPTPG
jgi:hypothetical protein